MSNESETKTPEITIEVKPDEIKTEEVKIPELKMPADFKRVILLTDKSLSSSERRNMNEHFSTLEFEGKWHLNKKITELEAADIFIINIGKGLSDRTDGMRFYETNRKLMTEDKYVIVYYRSEDYIRKDNLEKMRYDIRIVELPKKCEDADKYYFLLLSDKMPQVRPWYVRAWQALFKKK